MSAHQQEAIRLPDETTRIKMFAYLDGGEGGGKTSWRQAIVEELGPHQSDVRWIEGVEPIDATWEAVGEMLVEDAEGGIAVRQFSNIVDGVDGVNGRRMRGIDIRDLKKEKKIDVDRRLLAEQMSKVPPVLPSDVPYMSPSGCTELFLGGMLLVLGVIGMLIYYGVSLLT